jgi:hypothetical protein
MPDRCHLDAEASLRQSVTQSLVILPQSVPAIHIDDEDRAGSRTYRLFQRDIEQTVVQGRFECEAKDICEPPLSEIG